MEYEGSFCDSDAIPGSRVATNFLSRTFPCTGPLKDRASLQPVQNLREPGRLR